MASLMGDAAVMIMVVQLPVPGNSTVESHLVKELTKRSKGKWLHGRDYVFASPALNPGLYDEAYAEIGKLAQKNGFGFIVTSTTNGVMRTMRENEVIDRAVRLLVFSASNLFKTVQVKEQHDVSGECEAGVPAE